MTIPAAASIVSMVIHCLNCNCHTAGEEFDTTEAYGPSLVGGAGSSESNEPKESTAEVKGRLSSPRMLRDQDNMDTSQSISLTRSQD